jgi:hypothetical protein
MSPSNDEQSLNWFPNDVFVLRRGRSRSDQGTMNKL